MSAKKLIRIISVAFMAVVLLGVTACDDESSDPKPDMMTDVVELPDVSPDTVDPDVPDVVEPNASLRFVHLSPDAPAVDIFANATAPALVSDLAFAEGTPYLQVPAATYSVEIAAAGTSPDAAVLTIPALTLEGDTQYSAVAYGKLANLSVLPLIDGAADPGGIAVRAVHVAADVGTVDIWALGDSPAKVVSSLGFGVASEILDLPAAALEIGIDVDADAVPDLVFAIPALPAGTFVNLFAVQDNDGEVFLLAQLPNGTLVRIDAEEEVIPDPEMAMLRVLHLSPDAPAVDIFIDAATPAAVSGLAFGEGIDYVSLPVGTYSVQVAAAGGTPDAAVLTVDALTLEKDAKLTAVAYGELASIGALALVDAQETSSPDHISVRAIHTAAGVGTVDIWHLPRVGTPAMLYEDVPFGGVGEYLDLPAGAYTIGFDVNKDANPDLVFSLPALPGGTIANVFAVNDSDGAVFLLAQLGDSSLVRIDPDTAAISVIHLSPDAPSVDIFVNGGVSPAVSALAYGESTGYIDLAPGSYDFDVSVSGQPASAAVISIEDAALASGRKYSAVAYNEVASLSHLVLVSNLWGLAEGEIRVRAIHAAAGVGQVDIWEVSGTPAALLPDFDFGAVSDYLDLPAQAYQLGFDLDNDGTPELIFDIPALPAGTVADIFAVADSGGAYLWVQLDDGVGVRIDPN